MGHRHPRLPKPLVIWMVRWAKGFQLKPNYHQLGHCKLYVYEPRVYCTPTREFTSGHGVMCTVMVTLRSRYSLQCFASCFDILAHSIRQSFTPGPPLASGSLNFCLIAQVGDPPKFFLPMQRVLRRQHFALYSMYVCMYVCMCVCVRVYVCVWCVYVCVCVCVRVYVYVCVSSVTLVP